MKTLSFCTEILDLWIAKYCEWESNSTQGKKKGKCFIKHILYIQQEQPHYYWNSECFKIGSHPYGHKNEVSNEIAITMIAIAGVATWAIALLLNLQAQREIPGSGVSRGGDCYILPGSFYV